MTHQIDVLSAQKGSCLSRCVRARIVVVKSDLSSAVGFPDFLEDNWQTNGCVPLRTAVYFRSHTRKSTIHYLSQCHRRVSKPRNIKGNPRILISVLMSLSHAYIHNWLLYPLRPDYDLDSDITEWREVQFKVYSE